MIPRPYDCCDRGCAADVFGRGTLGPRALFDARVDDVDAYASFANSKGMRVTHVIDDMEQSLAFNRGLADTLVPA